MFTTIPNELSRMTSETAYVARGSTMRAKAAALTNRVLTDSTLTAKEKAELRLQAKELLMQARNLERTVFQQKTMRNRGM